MNYKEMSRAALILVISLALVGGILSASSVVAKPATRKPAAIGSRESAQRVEKDIAGYIKSKGTEHNFAEDQEFLDLVNAFAPALLKPESKDLLEYANHFAIGDLDGDKLPEIAVYEQRASADLDDPGTLVLYQIKDGKYQPVTDISMEYDNTCIKMVIGPAAPGQNALFMQTAVGAHSEMFYLFLLQDGKLEPAIDDSNARLLSAYASGDIADIDNDGIIEFSIYTEDPDCEGTCLADSDKISYWYKWNGRDGVKFVKYEQHKNNREEQPSDQVVLAELTAKLSGEDSLSAQEYLKANLSKLTKKDAAAALETYVRRLQQLIPAYDTQIESLQAKYGQDPKNDILTKYKLTMNDLNDIKCLQDPDCLKNEQDLKELLVKARLLGLQLQTAEGMYFFAVNYNDLLTDFQDEITNELTSWFQIRADYYNEPAMKDAALVVDLNEIAERIVAMEEFQFTFPYSKYNHELNRMHENYLLTYLYGANNTPSYDYETRVIKPEALASFEKTKKEALGYPLYNLVTGYLTKLQDTENKVTSELQKIMTAKVKEMVGGLYIDNKTVTAKTDILEVNVELPLIGGNSEFITRINSEIEQTVQEAQAEIEAGALEAKKAGATIFPYSLFTSYHVPWNQDGLLSIVCESYQFTGGAHGMTYKTAYNIDITGERLLSLADFFPERPDPGQYVKEEIKKAIQAEPEYYFEDALETIAAWEEEFLFYVENENVVVFFHPYDIAPYAGGFREFPVPWDALP